MSQAYLDVLDTQEDYNEVIMLDFNNDSSNNLNVTSRYESFNNLRSQNTITVNVNDAELCVNESEYYIKSNLDVLKSNSFYTNFTNPMKKKITCNLFSYDSILHNLNEDLMLYANKKRNLISLLGSIPVNNDDPEKINKRKSLFWTDKEIQFVTHSLQNLQVYANQKGLFDSKVSELIHIATPEMFSDIYVPYDTYIMDTFKTKHDAIFEFKTYEKTILLTYIHVIGSYIIANEKNLSDLKNVELQNYYNFQYNYLLNAMKELIFVKNTDTIYDENKVRNGYKTVMTPIDLSPLQKITSAIFMPNATSVKDRANGKKINSALSLLKNVNNKTLVIKINFITKEVGLDNLYIVFNLNHSTTEELYIINKIQQDLIRGNDILHITASELNRDFGDKERFFDGINLGGLTGSIKKVNNDPLVKFVNKLNESSIIKFLGSKKFTEAMSDALDKAAALDPSGVLGLATAIAELSEDAINYTRSKTDKNLMKLILSAVSTAIAFASVGLGVSKFAKKSIIDILNRLIFPLIGNSIGIFKAVVEYIENPNKDTKQDLIDACVNAGVNTVVSAVA